MKVAVTYPVSERDYTVEFLHTARLGHACVVSFRGTGIGSIRQAGDAADTAKMARQAKRLIRDHLHALRSLEGYNVGIDGT